MKHKSEVSLKEMTTALKRFQDHWPLHTTHPWHVVMGHRVGSMNISAIPDPESSFCFVVSPDAANKIRLLNSPHWQTMMKAMAAVYKG